MKKKPIWQVEKYKKTASNGWPETRYRVYRLKDNAAKDCELNRIYNADFPMRERAAAHAELLNTKEKQKSAGIGTSASQKAYEIRDSEGELRARLGVMPER